MANRKRNLAARMKITLPKPEESKQASARHLASIRRVMEESALGDKTEHLFLGRAGESFVAGHLLRGLNPARLELTSGSISWRTVSSRRQACFYSMRST